MAISFIRASTIQRAKGHSVSAALAYETGQSLERLDGESVDYRNRGGVENEAHIFGTTMGLQELADKMELAENRRNSCVGRRFIMALPHELSREGRAKVAQEFTEHLHQKYGVAGVLTIHEPDKRGSEKNHHAHLTFSDRKINDDGISFGAKVRELSDKRSRANLQGLKERWAEICNEQLQIEKIEEKLDPTPYAQNGKIAQLHEGKRQTEIRRKNEIFEEAQKTARWKKLKAPEGFKYKILTRVENQISKGNIPKWIATYAENKFIEWERDAESIKWHAKWKLRAVVSTFSDNEAYRERAQALIMDTLKFPNPESIKKWILENAYRYEDRKGIFYRKVTKKKEGQTYYDFCKVDLHAIVKKYWEENSKLIETEDIKGEKELIKEEPLKKVVGELSEKEKRAEISKAAFEKIKNLQLSHRKEYSNLNSVLQTFDRSELFMKSLRRAEERRLVGKNTFFKSYQKELTHITHPENYHSLSELKYRVDNLLKRVERGGLKSSIAMAEKIEKYELAQKKELEQENGHYRKEAKAVTRGDRGIGTRSGSSENQVGDGTERQENSGRKIEEGRESKPSDGRREREFAEAFDRIRRRVQKLRKAIPDALRQRVSEEKETATLLTEIENGSEQSQETLLHLLEKRFNKVRREYLGCEYKETVKAVSKIVKEVKTVISSGLNERIGRFIIDAKSAMSLAKDVTPMTQSQELEQSQRQSQNRSRGPSL